MCTFICLCSKEGLFGVRTLSEDGESQIESSYNVAGSTFFIGNLSVASVSPKMFGSAMRTSVHVSVTIGNTLQASAYIIVSFPALK